MKELLQIILNEYIPKNKINKFNNLISEYGFKNLTYFNEEKEIEINNYKIPLDILKQRLNSKIKEVEEPKVEEIDSTNKNILLNKCDEFFKKIDFLKKRNKYYYYYYFGFYLQRLKNIFILDYSVEYFNNFIEERYEMKTSKLYSYIRFYNLCQEYNFLLTCDLTFTDIRDNINNIKFLLSKGFSHNLES